MAALQLSVAPADGVEAPAGAAPVLVDVVYIRKIEGRAGDGVSDLPDRVQEALRFALDDRLRGTTRLVDAVPDEPVGLAFLGPAGTVRLTKAAVSADGGETLAIALSKDEVAAITAPEPQPAPAPPVVQRRAFFVPTSDVRVPFAASALQVAPVTVADGGWTALGLDQLFNADSPVSTAVELPADGWAQPAMVPWIATHVTVDGRFAFAVPQGAGDAWMWWLAGPLPAIGVMLDDLSAARVVRIGVPLPPFPRGAPAGEVPPGVPADVTESEVAENPGVYTEDPGSFCRPFRNPERVLGERSFFVVLRAEQPVISAESSVVADPLPTLGYAVLAENVLSTGAVFARASDAVRVPPGGIVADRPDVSFARHALPTTYVDMLRRFNRGRVEMDARNPVQWESDVSRYQATTVARGHILEYRMRWRSNGYSLGTVAKTLTLAPRQIRRIQKIEWRRAEAARRLESTEFAERAADTLQREREYDDSVQANLSEWARGRSSSSTTAGAVGAGFAAAGFVIGGGGARSSAESESSQEGGRRVSVAEEQRLRDSIRRFGDSLRKLESIVVTEVTQEESATGTVEVVRNQNYAHSLTVIYYQILRHLKVETAVAGVRECLFVPFPIRPFTMARAYRWRDLLRTGLREPRHAPALDWLKDVLSGFVNSPVPPNRRSDQPVQHIHGALFLRLAVERPRDKEDGGFDPDAWARVQPFLGTPAGGIFARLKALAEAMRDAAFQRDHAPTIAATWVDTLQFEAGGVQLAADFTLASRYQFNGLVRVDFSIANPSGQQLVTRELLSSIRIRATKDLPPGSVANLERLGFTYQTATFERTVAASQGAGDLVAVETGVRDTAGATVATIPDLWERQNIRDEMTTAVHGLVEHLNDHVEYYHKLIWWTMDRDRLFMLIDGFYVPGTNGVSIASVVERDPIAIVGNAIVFRVSAGAFLGLGDLKTPAALHNHYVAQAAPSEPILVSLPTDGLYAQAVMDECPALEEHFGNTDWALAEPDPELGAIAPELLASRRAEPVPTQPTPFPQTLINLQNAPEAPAPAGLAAALAAVTNANAFRDMAGLAGTQANAAAGFQAAATLASGFGAQAAALKLAESADKAQATQTADQKLATVQRAVDKKLTTAEDAQKHASSILESLHPQPATRPDPAAVLAQPIFASAGSIKAVTPEFHLEADLLGGGGAGVGGAGGGAAVPAWAAAIEPFPPAPTLVFNLNEPKMKEAFAKVEVSLSANRLCSALVDLTGDPAEPPYAGLNDDEMVFAGSMVKTCGMYAAFALRKQVQAFVDAAIANGVPAVASALIAEMERAWKPRLRALFPGRPTTAFGTSQDISFPQLAQIFSFGADGKVDFARATPAMSDAAIDGVGEFGAPQGGFHDWMRSMMRWSNNTAAGKVTLALGYFYLNGALAAAGLFDSGTENGLWLSADYAAHDWVRTEAERKANAAGPLLTQRWATAQKRRRSNITATASKAARMMTLMAQDKLVDAASSAEMRALLRSAIGGIGSYIEDALTGAGIAFTSIAAKKGFGDDSFSHECGIVERTVGGKHLRYVMVGLGSPPEQGRQDLSDLFVLMDAAIVERNA